MSSTYTSQTLVCENYLLTNYLPAMLKEFHSGWVIEFYVENPDTCRLVRKRIKLQRLICRYKTLREARKHINGMVSALNVKLAAGWNPFVKGTASCSVSSVEEKFQENVSSSSMPAREEVTFSPSQAVETVSKEKELPSKSDNRGDVSLEEVAAKFLKDIEENRRHDTFRSYSSFINVFVPWAKDNLKSCLVSQIKRYHIVDFLEYISKREGREGKITARGYNNYITNGSAFFSWMIDKCYCEENFFKLMRKKKIEEKKRTLITSEVRERIEEYLKVENPYYLLCLKLMYGGLLRPKEIRHLLVSDLSCFPHIFYA